MGARPDLDDLVAFLRARDDADPAVGDALRSQVLAGERGAGAVVLLHGLTAHPAAWRALAARLHAGGRTVVAFRLAHHGHADPLTGALRALDAGTLLGELSALIAYVVAAGEPLTLAGHSLGATLALYAAAHEPAVVRAVAVAPFLGIGPIPSELHPLLRPLLERFAGEYWWWDPLRRARVRPELGYPRCTFGALAAGLTIADELRVRAARPPLARAVEIVLNARESAVNNRTIRQLIAAWRGAGAPLTVHVLHGLQRSHDIIDPGRPQARLAFETLYAIVDGEHAPADHEHRIPRGVVRSS